MPTNDYAQHLFRGGLVADDVANIAGDDDTANIPALAAPPTDRYVTAPAIPATAGQVLVTDGAGGVTWVAGYETWVLWAEENGALAANTNEWSFGNGAVGDIGIPIVGDGWECWGWAMQADTATNGDTLQMEVMDFATADTPLATFTGTWLVAGGSGRAFGTFATPVAVPQGTVLGFRTDVIVGAAPTDVRVVLYLRRPVGS